MPRQKTAPRKLNEAFPESTPPVKKKLRKSSKSFNIASKVELQVQISECDFPYKLGSFTIVLQESKNFQTNDCFTLTFEPESTCCTVSWSETEENSETQEKTLLASCEIPYEILQDLYTLKIFHFLLNTKRLSEGNNIIQICLNPSTFIALTSASDPFFNHHRRKVYDLLKFFLKVEFEEYAEDYLYEDEQVEKLYSCIENCYDPAFPKISVAHDSLIPSLRKYQSQAVNWMLKQETSVDNQKSDLHELYTSLTMQDGQELYFHKYGGYFVNSKFAPEEPCTGGILADEMGLGKTLEVLACILLNPRNCSGVQNGIDSEQFANSDGVVVNGEQLDNSNRVVVDGEQLDNSNVVVVNGEQDMEHDGSLSDSDTETGSRFECVCGSEDYFYSSIPVVCCGNCGVLQHAECIFYDPESLQEDDVYTCPYCLINKSKLQLSRATLIISPVSIIYQWEQEISRHVKKDRLKVFMYLGVEHQNFVHPSYLADYDIVLVSYETLKKELNHVDIPHGKYGRSSRHPKKFLGLPSPLCSIEWWRICLDEAQMVESVSTKIAKMTGKLHSIHRWCVTGTPIKKSIEDLYGLLVFLDVKPYHQRTWWREVLWKPYVNGNILPLSSVLKRIAWRTPKYQVLDQMGVPGLEEVLHKLEFSAIERVFYERQHVFCRRDFLEKITKVESLDIKLHCMDKHFLSKIMLPLRRLQFVCCHFQINQGNVDVHKKRMTTVELLKHLLKMTKYECEEVHRKLLMAMSGAAGIYYIRNELQNAVDMYERTLNSIEDNKLHIRTDITQQIHSLYQLSNIFSVAENTDNKIESKLTLSEMTSKIEELSTEYVEKYKLTVEASRKDIDDVTNEISVIMSKFKLKRDEFPTSAWYATVFENVEANQRDSLMRRIEDVLKYAPGQTISIPGQKDSKNLTTLAKQISSISFFGLLSRLFEMSKDLHNTRTKLIEKVQLLNVEPTISMLNSAISCHMRPEPNKTEKKTKKCIYCEADDLFELYKTKLYRFDEKNEKSKRRRRKIEVEVEEENGGGEKKEENICFEKGRRGNQGDSDLELVLKFLLSYSRRFKDLPECTEDGVNEIKLFDAMKKEHKHLRNLWIKIAEYVQQKDEVEMAKISTRMLLPGETPPNPPVPYILLPHEVQSKLVQHHSDIISHQFELKKKMGQLFYLKNLEKAENKEAPFEENCPVCQQTFENSWSVLQCGHSFCLVCMQRLLSSKNKFTNNLGFVCQGVRCPVCRQYTAASDVYFIDNNKDKNKEEEISIKGRYSTKTSAVVKCLLEIKEKDSAAKCLVFSNFTEYLYTLEYALKENDVKCLNFSQRKHFQDHLEKFKKSEEINVLLIPLTFGYSGLNITEATHVLLLEPVLDNSKHLQAIGRVHRIGQTKKATVHRFFVSSTIEENIYDAVKNLSAKDNHIRSEFTLQNLVDVFKDC